MKIQRNFYMVTVILGLFLLNCFEKLSPTESQETTPVIPQQILFKGPNSANAPAELIQSLEKFNDYVSTGLTYLAIATIQKPDVNSEQFTWRVTAGGFNGLITAEKMNDELVQWKVTINGSDGTTTYNDWVALQGTADVKGRSGTWHVFEENSTNELGVYDWAIRENDGKEATFSNSNASSVYKVVNQPDQSGSFNRKENDKKVYEAIWDKTGAGTWQQWDELGNVAGSGGWI